MNNNLFRFFITLTFTNIILANVCFAQPNIQQSDSNDSLLSTPNNENHFANTPVLKGGVEKVELDLEKLQEVGIDLKKVLRAATGLYDAASIQPVRLITQPNIVGAGTIVNIPVGIEPTGPPPPIRKERIDTAMKSMAPTINLLKKNVDDFVAGKKQLDLPENVLAKLDPKFKDWTNLVNSVSYKQNQLAQLAKIPPYDNKIIGDLSLSIQQDVKALEKTRLAIYKTVKKESKNK